MPALIQKIFKSFDFRGNKIFNAKVNTPTQDQHIANKEYVDNSTSNSNYDTVKAETYQNPFLFPLILNVFGKSVKQLFDDLFFPRILPIYTNPVITNIRTYFTNNQIVNAFNESKYLVYMGQQTTGKFNYTLLTGDRVSSVLPTLTITDGESVQIFTADSLNAGFIEFAVLITPSVSFVFDQQFGIAQTKQDSYGDDYIPNEFGLLYNYSIDVTTEIFKYSLVLNSMMISGIRADQSTPTYDESNALSQFTNKNTINIPAGSEGIYDMLVPSDNPYAMSAEIFNSSGTEKLNEIILPKIWITRSDNISPYIILNGKYYYKYQFNFGVFDKNILIKIKFN